MKKTTVRFDEQVYTWLVRLAEEQDMSISHFINATLARCVADDGAFALFTQRAQRARLGAMRRVLDHTATYGLQPQEPEDHIPPDFDQLWL
jgi:hypothetical protein